MKNVLGLVLESVKYVIESFIYFFSVYYVFKFYYLSSSFTILCIYVIISCLVFTFFAYYIKFLHGFSLLHDFLLYFYQPVCVIDVFTRIWFNRLRARIVFLTRYNFG